MVAEKKDTMWARVAYYSELGFLLPAYVLAGYIVGYQLDRWIGTSPVLSVIFLFLGFAGGFLQLYRMLQKRERDGDNSGS